MSEVAPVVPLDSSHDQASVEPAAPAVEQAAAPAVDESAVASAAPSTDAAPPAAPAPAPDVAPELTELDNVRSRFEAVLAENAHLKEQLALHAASNAVDASAALKQIAALAAPFA